MGAGAGYTIKFDIGAVGGTGDVAKGINSIDYAFDGSYGMLIIDGRIDCYGKVYGSSYYYGSGWIENVAVVATHIEMDVSWAWDLLTDACVDRIEAQFGDSINNIDFSDYGETLTTDDFDLTEVAATLDGYLSFEEESKVIGGGWTHSTFGGDAEVETNDLYKVILEIPNKEVVSYLDEAIRGDNETFEVVFDGNPGDVYDTLDEAIASLKAEIDSTPDIDTIDLDDCYVDSMYYMMTIADPMEFDYDYDNNYVHYRASEDPDYQEYL